MNTQTTTRPSSTVNITSISSKTPVPGKSRSPAGKTPAKTSSPSAAPAAQPTNRHEVVFRLGSSQAREVLLAGSFTDWTKAPISLRKDVNGTWQTKVLLAPGTYRYKFLVDGEWEDDPASPSRCPNPFGTSDNVLEVS